MAYKRKGINRLQMAQEEQANTLKAMSSWLPLNELPKWNRDAITECHEDGITDPVNVAAVHCKHFRKSQTNHDETNVPDMDRPSTAIYRADCGGKEWIGQGALVGRGE